jgi:hypothetical protein
MHSCWFSLFLFIQLQNIYSTVVNAVCIGFLDKDFYINSIMTDVKNIFYNNLPKNDHNISKIIKKYS